MTREDAIKLLALIKVAYPSSYRDMDKASAEATVNMWYTSFSDVPYVLMEMVFNNFRVKSKFPPTVADFFDELRGLYWTACENLLSPFITDDAAKRCNFIVDCTSRFCHTQQAIDINYAAISNDLLNASEYKLLTEG